VVKKAQKSAPEIQGRFLRKEGLEFA
jgi:hypothetical protein